MASRFSLKNTFILTWKIKDFSCFLKNKKDGFLESPKFSESSTAYENWSMRLYPKGTNSDAYISFQLCRSANVNGTEMLCTSENTVDFVIFILAKDGLTMLGDEMIRAKFTTLSSESIIYDFVKRDELKSRESHFLPKDTLTIQCNLMQPVQQHIVTVRCQVQKISFTWTIRNFSRIQLSQFDHADRSYSVSISCAKAPRVVLQFHLVGKSLAESYLRIDSSCNSSLRGNRPICSSGCKHFDSGSISVSFSVSISENNGQRRRLIECEHSFVSLNGSEIFRLPELMKRRNLIARSDLFLADDNLKLLFDLKLSNGKCITTDERRIITLASPPERRRNTLGRILLENKKFCDVTLKVGNEEYPVHKSVICSKSPIFDSLFTCDTQEKKNCVVDIVGVSSDTLKHLLQYMYTGTLEECVLDDIGVAHLYFAAHKYKVTSLAEHCSALLKSKIDAGNVWDIASVAAAYQDTALIEASKYFISQQPSRCLESDRWHVLLHGQSLFLNRHLD